jgi:Spy/CpxP family protein refolding chaperone
MRFTRRLTLALLTGALALSLSGEALAQRGQNRRPTGTYAQAILRKLNLNADQQAKVKTAEDAYRAEVEKARASGTPQETRQASRAARRTYQEAVRSALNADQQKQLDAMIAEAQEFRVLGPGNAAQMAGLNLTAEQKTKVKEIGAKYEPELTKLRAEQRGATDRQAVQAKIREQQTKMLDEIKTVLTPDQVKQLTPPRRRRNNQNNQ